MLDVCVDFVGRDGVPRHARGGQALRARCTAPLMLDSTKPAVMEAGLKLRRRQVHPQLGEPRGRRGEAGQICALRRKYGAAVVALTIDEDKIEAMAKTAERKIAIATRIRDLLVEQVRHRRDGHPLRSADVPDQHGHRGRPPLRAGDDRRHRAHHEGKFPRCQTIVGLSQRQLRPEAGGARACSTRSSCTSCAQRGLTAAIVHAGKILPRNADPRRAVERGARPDLRPPPRGLRPAASASSASSRRRASRRREDEDRRSADRGAAQAAHHRRQPHRPRSHLDEAMTKYTPLEIINTILLDGMKVVGELFGCGQMQLPVRAASRPRR